MTNTIDYHKIALKYSKKNQIINEEALAKKHAKELKALEEAKAFYEFLEVQLREAKKEGLTEFDRYTYKIELKEVK